jgi:hypothetical protein
VGYYHYYRRPYFRNRSHRGFSKARIILWVLGLCLLSGVILSSGPAAVYILFGFAFWIGIIYLIYLGVKTLYHRGWKEPIAGTSDPRRLADLNSEKHGCKCYMEGLTTGEQEVAETLSRDLDYKKYFLFNNLFIPSQNNGSTQIDHIVVSRYGIFVIESKDYNGWIFGSSDDAKWTQTLAAGKVKSVFQNPIHQNYAHVMGLKALMPFAAHALMGLVVFTDKSEFKTPPIPNVVHLRNMIGCIRVHTSQMLTEEQVQRAIGTLSYSCQTADITLPEHLANLKASHAA